MRKKKSAATARGEFEFVVEPAMLNHLGILHGGSLVKKFDSSAGYIAAKFSEGKVVTAAMLAVNFDQRIPCGQMVKIKSEIFAVGKSSMKVKVEVLSAAMNGSAYQKAGSAFLVFIGVDDDFKSRQVPELYFDNEAACKRAEELSQQFDQLKEAAQG
ncbi:acyl-CoA thioesterase [Halanaerobium salsuginis]|jgi:acyl-CoA thioesterase YciA|uniref:Acyl-CoA hydrolase n=1 Tax=Halanaerobium salsuginis TaxID=29563 RepID=A0A1I4FKE4_9FIRM|nr:hotdog domain-containing protein [Halanaerobium salsuginis]SFL18394.1 Acyl-CoA hydrolase [Halanaerobium salsuginis]